MPKIITTNEFIENSIKIHGNKYLYTNTEYIKGNIKVKIICPVHGQFLQSPINHLNTKGCPKCGYSNRPIKSTNNKQIKSLLSDLLDTYTDDMNTIQISFKNGGKYEIMSKTTFSIYWSNEKSIIYEERENFDIQYKLNSQWTFQYAVPNKILNNHSLIACAIHSKFGWGGSSGRSDYNTIDGLRYCIHNYLDTGYKQEIIFNDETESRITNYYIPDGTKVFSYEMGYNTLKKPLKITLNKLVSYGFFIPKDTITPVAYTVYNHFYYDTLNYPLKSVL